jgi:hypothetical protein
MRIKNYKPLVQNGYVELNFIEDDNASFKNMKTKLFCRKSPKKTSNDDEETEVELLKLFEGKDHNLPFEIKRILIESAKF